MQPTPTLANIPLDLQITICTFLHPSDILALRKTCKALELATRIRIVWVTVLHRVCIDNTIFLPTFPIPDMSNLELERAAMAPRRWIELYGAFQEQHSNDFSAELRPRTTRIIKDHASVGSLFIVPGGRYLVTAGNGIFVWDLGYTSSVDCKLLASFGEVDEGSDDYHGFEIPAIQLVQATRDGKGLVILSKFSFDHLSIFEIYPQSETPLLTRIAHWHFNWFTGEKPAYLFPDTLICCQRVLRKDIVFRVVDYRTNYSIRFSSGVEVHKNVKTFATKTAIIVFSKEGILIWAIPPLSPRSSDLLNYLPDEDPTHIPPLFKIPYPNGTIHHLHKILTWKTVSSWYFESWGSVYFDIIKSDTKLLRFKINIEPDLSDASLHLIYMSEITSEVFWKTLLTSSEYSICEDALVSFWDIRYNMPVTWGAFVGLTSAPFTNVVMKWDGDFNFLTVCPTSGRFVYTDVVDSSYGRCKIVVADLF